MLKRKAMLGGPKLFPKGQRGTNLSTANFIKRMDMHGIVLSAEKIYRALSQYLKIPDRGDWREPEKKKLEEEEQEHKGKWIEAPTRVLNTITTTLGSNARKRKIGEVTAETNLAPNDRVK